MREQELPGRVVHPAHKTQRETLLEMKDKRASTEKTLLDKTNQNRIPLDIISDGLHYCAPGSFSVSRDDVQIVGVKIANFVAVSDSDKLLGMCGELPKNC